MKRVSRTKHLKARVLLESHLPANVQDKGEHSTASKGEQHNHDEMTNKVEIRKVCVYTVEQSSPAHPSSRHKKTYAYRDVSIEKVLVSNCGGKSL